MIIKKGDLYFRVIHEGGSERVDTLFCTQRNLEKGDGPFLASPIAGFISDTKNMRSFPYFNDYTDCYYMHELDTEDPYYLYKEATDEELKSFFKHWSNAYDISKWFNDVTVKAVNLNKDEIDRLRLVLQSMGLL